jgi:hypothetical protein
MQEKTDVKKNRITPPVGRTRTALSAYHELRSLSEGSKLLNGAEDSSPTSLALGLPWFH